MGSYEKPDQILGFTLFFFKLKFHNNSVVFISYALTPYFNVAIKILFLFIIGGNNERPELNSLTTYPVFAFSSITNFFDET